MTSKVIYNGGLRTTAVHTKSGNTLVTDAPTDNRGKGEGFSPTDLAATSLASCMLTIMGIKAHDKGIDMTGATADVQKIMASDPRRIARIEITITMPRQDYTVKEKKILERSAHSCPVGRSLHPKTEEVVEIIWQ